MTKYAQPDASGHFGIYGGLFVADTLIHPLEELKDAYYFFKNDKQFKKELASEYQDFVGRPTPLYLAKRLTAMADGANIYLKREDLNHTGAHKINNALAQGILAKRMGKTRLIAETGAGQHGVATATIAARLDMSCAIYMGQQDIQRQSANVYRMKLLGAEVIPVLSGSQTLKDALNEAMRDWVSNVDKTYYVIGTVAGPHPYPEMVRDFQSIIGREAREQILQKTGKLPQALVACIGGGSNAMGLFYPFLNDKDVALYGVEAGGTGVEAGQHSASLTLGKPGVLHGNRSYLLYDKAGQITDTHSISAGLDYPGVGPEHAFLKDAGRARYVIINDEEALFGFRALTRLEGILPALESSHAIAYALKLASQYSSAQNIVVNLSGRGDKDIHTIANIDGIKL